MVASTVPSASTRIQQILLITARHFLNPLQDQVDLVQCLSQFNTRYSRCLVKLRKNGFEPPVPVPVRLVLSKQICIHPFEYPYQPGRQK